MVRVCKPDGRVAVVDTIASDDPRKAEMFNRMEKRRDPSHVKALTLSEMLSCFQQAGLAAPAITPYKMTVELEGLLKASFPEDGNRQVIREMIVTSLEHDTLGVETHTKDGSAQVSYPIAILMAKTHATQEAI